MVGSPYDVNSTHMQEGDGENVAQPEYIDLRDPSQHVGQPEDSNLRGPSQQDSGIITSDAAADQRDLFPPEGSYHHSHDTSPDLFRPEDSRPRDPYPDLFQPEDSRPRDRYPGPFQPKDNKAHDPCPQEESPFQRKDKGLLEHGTDTEHPHDVDTEPVAQKLYNPEREELSQEEGSEFAEDLLIEDSEDSLSEDTELLDTLLGDESTMTRKSQRFIWKEGDGNGRKNDSSPKLYDEPPHKLVENDDTTFPPKYVDLSSMWVYQIVRCHFISQKMRYERWPAVFPSKEPLRSGWTNKGLPAKLWSDVREKWVYPVVFGKYQLHGEEGVGHFDTDQSKFIESKGTNTDHEIREGTDCVVQKPPASSGGLSSGGLAAASEDQPTEPSSEDSTDEAPDPKRQKLQTGIRSKVPVEPKVQVTPKSTKSKTEKSAPRKDTKAEDATEIKSSPSTRIISSATGVNRFAIDDSDSEETQDNVKDLLNQIENLKLEKASYERELRQAQGKVVLLAASLHSVWNVLGAYSERLTEWSSVFKKWEKGPGGTNAEEFKNAMKGLKDNRSFNNRLLMKVNKTFNDLSNAFPALDRITLDDDKFDTWRNARPTLFEKLIEEGDQNVNGQGKIVVKKERK